MWGLFNEYSEEFKKFRNAVEDLDGIRNEIREEDKGLDDVIEEIELIVRSSNDELDFSFEEILEYTIKMNKIIDVLQNKTSSELEGISIEDVLEYRRESGL